MDPQACWQRFLDACADDDREEAYHAAIDLMRWLCMGGCRPDGVPSLDAVRSLVNWLEQEEFV